MLQTKSGKTVDLTRSKEIAAGGEGKIYEHPASKKKVVKLYHQVRPAAYADHLAVLSKLPDQFVRPGEVLYINSKVAGFEMEYVNFNNYWLFNNLFNKGFCNANSIDEGFKIRVLWQLRQALEEIHKLGIVVGDLNQYNLFVSKKGEILNELQLNIVQGKVTALLGRNGSGKSTLLNVVTHHPSLKLDGDIKNVPEPLFLGFQKPVEIPELSTGDLLLYLDDKYGMKSESIEEFAHNYSDVLSVLNVVPEMFSKPLNKELSGGENKRLELLQMYVMKPKLVLLDEIDTGLDIDILISIGTFLADYITKYKPTVVIVTHNLSFLKYFKVNHVVVLDGGRIVADTDGSIIPVLETKGFAAVLPSLN